MAVEYPGNVIPAPKYSKGNYSLDDELMYSMVGYTQKGVTLAPGQGILPLGTVMGRVTSTKLWKVYNNSASDGTEVARGILRQTVDTGTSTGADKLQGNIVIAGIVKNSKVSGADSAALTDLNARTDTVLDTFSF
jgi:hypothetical protein